MATQTTTIESGVADAIPMRRLGKDGLDAENSMSISKGKQGILSEVDNMGGLEPQSGSAEETHDYPTGLKFWLIIVTLGALLVLGGLDTNIVATAVPRYV
jgi:hypothetical protein